MRVSGRVWKWLGVAGVAGVAATGAVVARDHRRRAAVSPDQVRKQLHRRLAEAERGAAGGSRDRSSAGRDGVPEPARLPVKRRR